MLFTSCTSNIVTQDIALAHQMTKDILGHSLMLLKTIEWESLLFSSGAIGCGLLPENCSVGPHESLK